MTSPQAPTTTADPNARVSSTLLEKPDDFKTAGVTVLPSGVVVGTGNGQYYGYKIIYADGHTEIEWYQRGTGTGAQDDPVAMRTPGPVATDIKDKWDKERKAEGVTAGKKEVRKHPGTDPATNLPAIVTEYEDGSKSYDSSTTTATTSRATIGRVEGTPMPGGGFDNTKPIWVERDQNGQQVGPAKPLTTDQRQQWERDKNGGLTDQELRDRNNPENRVGKPTGRTDTITRNGQTVKRTEYLLPDGTKEWREQTETTEPDRIGKPTGATRTKTENGQVVKETEYVLPDGKTEWRAQTAPVADQTMPPDMPPFSPDINKPALGLIEYTQKVYALAAQKRPDGTPYLTEQQKNQALTVAHQMATTEATRLDNIRASQAQAQTNAINQRNADLTASVNRGNQANTATQNAFDTGIKLASMMTPKNYTPGLLPAIMGIQNQRMQNWGGMERPAAVTDQGYPMLQGINQLGLPSSAAALGELGQPGDPTQSSTVTPQQVAGPGAAVGPVAGGVTATNAAAINPTGPNVQAATEATMQGSNAAFGALGVSPPEPPAPPAPPSPLGPIGPANLFPTPQGMQVQHPVVQSVLGQNNDPQWAQAVAEAARQMGLAA